MSRNHRADEDTRRLPPHSLRLERDAYGRVNLTICSDEQHENVSFSRILPLAAPSKYVMVLDSAGREIGLIEDLNQLSDKARQIIEEELEISYFTPRILRILKSNSKSGVISFDVETDRGPARIFIRDTNDIRYYPNNRVILLATSGVRYEIPNLLALDRKSQIRFEEQT